MARRRKEKLSDLELVGRWLFFVTLPAVLLALPRLVMWCIRIMPGNTQKRTPDQAKCFYQSSAWRRVRIQCLERNIATYWQANVRALLSNKSGRR